MLSVEGVIDSYIQLIPKNASEAQIRETRLSFIAGMHAMKTLTMSATAVESDEIAETRMAIVFRDLEKQVEEAFNV